MVTNLVFKMGKTIEDLENIKSVPGTIYLVTENGELYYGYNTGEKHKITNTDYIYKTVDKTILMGVTSGAESAVIGSMIIGSAKIGSL